MPFGRRRRAPLRDTIDHGRRIGPAAHAANQACTARLRSDVDLLFDRFDVRLAPSAAEAAPLGLRHTGDPPCCRPWSLLGLRGAHLPFATGSTGLPVGLQMVGRHADETRVFAAAQWAMQRLTG